MSTGYSSSNHGLDLLAHDNMDTEERCESSKRLAADAAAKGLAENFAASLADADFVETEHENDDDEEEDVEAVAEGDIDFSVPQRFTKCGRKRAVPFPLKVRLHFRARQMSTANVLSLASTCLPHRSILDLWSCFEVLNSHGYY